MKTSLRIAVLGLVTLGTSMGLMGCAENNDKNTMALPDGTSVKGKAAPNAPRSSDEARQQQLKSSPTNNDAYKKAMSGH